MNPAFKKLLARKSYGQGVGSAALGEVQPEKLRLSAQICKRKHRWKESRYSRTCLRCGVSEDKVCGP